MNWFVWKDGGRIGPFSFDDVAALVLRGELTRRHVVCPEDRCVWKPLALVPEFAAVLASAATAGSTDGGPVHVSLPQEPIVPEGVQSPTAQAESDPLAPAATTSPRRVPQVPASSSSSYLARHWRGELSLPVSYWVNGIGASAAVSFAAALLSRLADFPSSPRFWSALAILLWVVAFVGAVWQVVGVWRSAGRHASRGGRPALARAARAAVLLGVVQLFVLFGTQALPQVMEYGRMALGRDPIHGSRVRLLRNGSEVEVAGYIAFGLTDEVRATLDAHPGITVIHLNSDGGRVAEARKLRDLITSRNLSTYTSSRCVSACVIPFLAGQRRLVASNAKIGFHQYSFAGMTGAAVLEEMETDKRYFLSRGVSDAFVRQAFRQSDVLWYPAVEQMRAAGYITGYAGSDEVALSGMSAGEIDKVDEALRQEPLYAAIAEHEPEVYHEIAAAVRDGFLQGQSLAELRSRTNPLIQDLSRKRLPFASDQAVVSFARVMVDEIDVLNRADPEKCRAYLFPDDGRAADVRAELGSDLVQREMQTMGDVITSAATGQWRPPSEEELAPIRARVVSRLALTWPAEDLEQLQHMDRHGDSARVCRVCYRLYKAITALPQHEAGPMLRSMFAGSN